MAKRKYTTSIVKKMYADGRVEDVEEEMNLEQMQEFVGGYITYVPSTERHRSLVVNEEGEMKNLPINQNATMVVSPRFLIGKGILGNALLVKS